MAAVPLNRFKTIRAGITTNSVGIYTCPIGVSAVVLLAQATNLTNDSTAQVTAYHSRATEAPSDYKFANEISIPPNDSLNLVPDGRLVLETSDIIKIEASAENELNFVLSVLESAKQ
jgi:hypothetical protein